MLGRRLISKEEIKIHEKREKEQEAKRSDHSGRCHHLIMRKSHATGRSILRQPVKVPPTVPCNAAATSFCDISDGKPATLQ